ncbi:MAG: TadE family protein [Candidatus Acidiferrales bacterium]
MPQTISTDSRQRGSTLVEFAVVLTVLFMFLFGVMDFARALYAYHFVANAAREGARYAIVRGSTCSSWGTACPAAASDIQTYLRNVPLGINPNNVTVTTTWTPNNNPGSTVQVKVQYSFQFILPFLPKSTLVMTSASQMVIAQ